MEILLQESEIWLVWAALLQSADTAKDPKALRGL